MKVELNPLFQLNLLIHLSLPYPDGSNFYPYFNRKGFVVKQIEKSIPLEPGSINKLKAIIEPQKTVTPEVVLFNSKSKEYLLIECKMKNFNVDWSQHGTRQAVGYLSLTPSYLKDFFALESKTEINTKVIYGVNQVNQNNQQEMFDTLQCISEAVEETLGYVMEHDAFGIEITPKGLFLNVRKGGKVDNVRIIKENALLNNALIYIIPVDINGQLDQENKEVLQTQVRNSIRSVLGKSIGTQPFSFNSTKICKKINPVWEQLPPAFKKKMRRWVHNYIKEIISQINLMGIDIEIEGQNYSFAAVDEKKVKSVRKFLISDAFLETGKNIFDETEQMTIDEFIV